MNTQLTIGELEVCLCRQRNQSEWACLVKFGETKIDIEYEYQPGEREIIRADPNDSQQGWPASITISGLTLAEPMTYEAEGVTTTIDKGVDIYHLLSKDQVEKLEDEILAGMVETYDEYERRAA